MIMWSKHSEKSEDGSTLVETSTNQKFKELVMAYNGTANQGYCNALQSLYASQLLDPQVCLFKMFYPKLVYKNWFPIQQIWCKWHGCHDDCVQRNNFYNPMGPRIVAGSNPLTFVFCDVYQCCKQRDRKEGRNHYRGYDPELLVQLPKHVRTQLNAMITGHKAIKPIIFKDLESVVHSKTTFSMKSKMLREWLRDAF
jgi:hypothetical protein